MNTNPIRIAKGFPTEVGYYWYKWNSDKWEIAEVCQYKDGKLYVTFPAHHWDMEDLQDEEIVWSTRIPTPELAEENNE